MRALLVTAFVFSLGCSDRPSNESCDKLVEHVIDLRLQSASLEGAKADEMREKLKAEIGESTKNFCLEKLPTQQVECGLKAASVEAIADCDKS